MPFADFDAMLRHDAAEADAYYADRIQARSHRDERAGPAPGMAGLLWSKQFYHYDVKPWLEGDPPSRPAPASASTAATPTGRTCTTST